MEGRAVVHLIIHHRVRDFDQWRPFFDGHSGTRKKKGGLGGHLFRSLADPNETFILFEWESLEQAKRFADSDELAATMNLTVAA